MAQYVQGAGIMLDAVGKIKSSRDQAFALRSKAQQAELNADSAILEAKFNSEKQAMASRQLIESGKAAYDAVGLSGGSAYAVLAASSVNAEMDRLSELYGGDIRSINFKNEAQSLRTDAKRVRAAGEMDAMATILQGAGSMGGAAGA